MGGTGNDMLVDYVSSDATSFLLAGTSSSTKGKDKGAQTVGGTGYSDYWVLK